MVDLSLMLEARTDENARLVGLDRRDWTSTNKNPGLSLQRVD